MDCQRRRLFIIVALTAIVVGCTQEQAETPPAPPHAGDPAGGVSPISYRSGSELEDLAAFLRDPPRLTSELQRVVARPFRAPFRPRSSLFDRPVLSLFERHLGPGASAR